MTLDWDPQWAEHLEHEAGRHDEESEPSCPDCQELYDEADTAYDRAIAYAAERGAEDGRNAAEWYIQDALTGRADSHLGNVTVHVNARRILRGIEDGDPAVLDTFPYPDLSGQWADTLTGPQLVKDAIVAADDWTMTRDEWRAYWEASEPLVPICDAYEDAYSTAMEDTIVRAARAILSAD